MKLPATAEVRWRYDFDQGIGDPVAADGVIYLTGNEGSLFALRGDGSGVIWQADLPGRRLADAPALVGDRIFVATTRGLSALSRANGNSLWDYVIAGGAGESAPLIVGERVLVAGYDGSIHAVNFDGTLAWTHDLAGDAPPSPPGFDQKQAVIGDNAARPGTMASDGVTVVVPIFDQSRVVAVDAATGQRRWSFQSKGWMYGEPAIAGDDVFVTSQDGHLYCLNKANGAVRWSFQTQGRVESGVGVRAGAVYVGSCDGFVYKVDAATGKLAWSFETARDADGKHSAIYSSPIVGADLACIGSFDGFVYALRVADGTLGWKVTPVVGSEVCSSPSTDGRLVFATVRADFSRKTGANSLVAIGPPPAK